MHEGGRGFPLTASSGLYQKNQNMVVLAEGCNVIMMASICTGKMSGRMAETARTHTEERNVATRDGRGAVDRRNSFQWPLYAVFVVYSLREWTAITITSVIASTSKQYTKNRSVWVIGCFVLLVRVIKLRIRLVVHMARKGAKRKAYRILVG